VKWVPDLRDLKVTVALPAVMNWRAAAAEVKAVGKSGWFVMLVPYRRGTILPRRITTIAWSGGEVNGKDVA
jgi:hypothetical protein